MTDRHNSPKANAHPGLWLAVLCTQETADRQLMVAQIRQLFAPYGWTGSKPAKWGYLADPRGEHSSSLPWTIAACIGCEVVGSASLVRRDNSEHDCGPWLAGLVVHPDYKKLGIGSILIAEVERHAAHIHRCGHPDMLEGKIYLDTERTINAFDSVAMYARRGWDFLSSEYEHRQDGIVMSKTVTT
ncbi:MAG: GNAT family N-acetyltransferase [Candidatus Obscuribacterales bacterium]|nr:GNAT family N-acetyltransferase [Candidatus Obscuribacterales bacterium]